MEKINYQISDGESDFDGGGGKETYLRRNQSNRFGIIQPASPCQTYEGTRYRFRLPLESEIKIMRKQ